MGLVHLSNIFNEIIEERIDFSQSIDEEVKQEKLKNARKEEKKKLRRVYDLFDIDINRLSVNDRYYINEEYKESIIWILRHTGSYKKAIVIAKKMHIQDNCDKMSICFTTKHTSGCLCKILGNYQRYQG